MTVDEAIVIDGEMRVVTDNSVWLVRPDMYCRFPRREEPRHVESPALRDAQWHAHVGAWRVDEGIGVRVRLMPPDRPAGSSGVLTGVIVASTPDVTSAAAAGGRVCGQRP